MHLILYVFLQRTLLQTPPYESKVTLKHTFVFFAYLLLNRLDILLLLLEELDRLLWLNFLGLSFLGISASELRDILELRPDSAPLLPPFFRSASSDSESLSEASLPLFLLTPLWVLVFGAWETSSSSSLSIAGVFLAFWGSAMLEESSLSSQSSQVTDETSLP